MHDKLHYRQSGAYTPTVQGVQRTSYNITGTRVNSCFSKIFGFSHLVGAFTDTRHAAMRLPIQIIAYWPALTGYKIC